MNIFLSFSFNVSLGCSKGRVHWVKKCSIKLVIFNEEISGSVVECWACDREVAGLSCVVSLSKPLHPQFIVQVQPRTHHNMTEKLLTCIKQQLEQTNKKFSIVQLVE